MDEQTDPTQQNQQDSNSQPTPPMGGGQGSTTGGQTTGDQGTQPAAGQKDDKKNLSGIMEENVDISGLVASAGNKQQIQGFIDDTVIPPHPNTTFDEKKFIALLAGSISLTSTEKHRIIQAIPQLSQFQIDELMKIFEEEKGKFTELEKKHAKQIEELEKQHKDSAQDEQEKAKEEGKKEEEAKEAEDIKKQLGL